LKICPPIVMAPVRAVVLVLAATLKRTVPLVVPLAPLVTWIQLRLLTAVQPHEVPVTVTVTLPVVPVAAAVIDVGLMV
jgi:hypothetical protein